MIITDLKKLKYEIELRSQKNAAGHLGGGENRSQSVPEASD